MLVIHPQILHEQAHVSREVGFPPQQHDITLKGKWNNLLHGDFDVSILVLLLHGLF